MISNKYYAGMIDADGSVSVSFQKSGEEYKVYARVSIFQRTDTTGMLHNWAVEWGSKVYAHHQMSVVLSGNKAVRALERTKQHMVVRKHVAELVISLNGQVVSKEGCKEIRQMIKEARMVGQPKNYPSRQWAAGFLDGDGCISTHYKKDRGVTYFMLSACSHVSQASSLRLLCKAYGGNIYSQGNVLNWKLHLNVERANTVLSPLVKHLKIKRTQAEYALHCLRTGKHLQKESAEVVHETMKSLKRPATTKYSGPETGTDSLTSDKKIEDGFPESQQPRNEPDCYR